MISLVSKQAISLEIKQSEIRHPQWSWKKDLSVTHHDWVTVTPTTEKRIKANKIIELMCYTGGNKQTRTICTHFTMNQSDPSRMPFKIHGFPLDKLKQLWGEAVWVNMEVAFDNLEPKPVNQNAAYNYRCNYNTTPYNQTSVSASQSHMPIVVPTKTKRTHIRHGYGQGIVEDNFYMENSQPLNYVPFLDCYGNVQEDPFERVEIDECSETAASSEDKNFQLPTQLIYIRNRLASQHCDYALNITVSLNVTCEDAGEVDGVYSLKTEDNDVFGKLSSTCENILSRKVNADLTIIASNRAALKCHKCFLSVNSTVLAAMLDSNMKESKSSQIELLDVTEPCVKALLEYLYTFKITQGRKSSKLAVEMFQVAHKYDISQLEKEMAQILLERANSWYDVNAALDLFRFSRNVEEHKTIKLKCVQVLQLKAEELLKSENYKKLFNEDLTTAMELCAIALKR
ncbi:BTB/POZ domain-containing protein [Orchesella cincta]|uniref:BTB/POZ domain-containing protein n=1 Tax=Orchesella cincta TaxID=48709 RepID=A0A1D2M734_ORCCI|nr:BTB/POZ domain-containing protein [Orchesella cincta]